MLTATKAHPGVALTWPTPSDGGAAITDYTIQRSPTGAATWTTVLSMGQSTVTAMDTTAVGETTYDFRICSTNAVGQFPWSSISTAQAGSVTITVADDVNRADSSTLGSTPTGAKACQVTAGNSFAIASNLLTALAVVNTNPRDVYVDAATADCTIQVKMTSALAQAGGGGIRFRRAMSSGYVFFHDSTEVYRLYRRTGSCSYSQIGVRERGKHLCWVNGAQVISVSATTSSSNLHGVWMGNGTSVDFSISVAS